MSEIPVYINERPFMITASTPAAEAIAAADATWADALKEGRAYLTDGRGIRLDPRQPLGAGAIVRVVISARSREGPDANP